MTTNTVQAGDRAAPAAKPTDILRILSFVLGIIGLGIASYLTWSHLFSQETACLAGAGWNCELVQHSYYSTLGPIPVAYLGLAGYIAIFVVLLLESQIPRARIVIFAFTLFGLLFSGYLTSIEAFVLHAWCIWCVMSAITMTLLFFVSFGRLWQAIYAVDPDDLEDETEA
jgi:uncharacterized membrane protein